MSKSFNSTLTVLAILLEAPKLYVTMLNITCICRFISKIKNLHSASGSNVLNPFWYSSNMPCFSKMQGMPNIMIICVNQPGWWIDLIRPSNAHTTTQRALSLCTQPTVGYRPQLPQLLLPWAGPASQFPDRRTRTAHPGRALEGRSAEAKPMNQPDLLKKA